MADRDARALYWRITAVALAVVASRTLTQMLIGASSNTGTANGFLGAISKFIVAEADIYGTEHQASALAFLNG